MVLGPGLLILTTRFHLLCLVEDCEVGDDRTELEMAGMSGVAGGRGGLAADV